jgi:outer membrane protein assembly factor BamB
VTHSYSGSVLAVSSTQHKVVGLNSHTGEVLWKCERDDPPWFKNNAGRTRVSWSPDDKLVLLAGYDGVTLIDATGNC